MRLNKLQKYVIAKAKILEPFGKYVNKEDIKELATWDEPAILKVLHESLEDILSNDMHWYHFRLAPPTILLMSPFCPWCIRREIYDESCEQCEYGTRHMMCSKPAADGSRPASTWRTILHNIDKALDSRDTKLYPKRSDIARLYKIVS